MVLSLILGLVLGIAIPTLLPFVFNVTLSMESQIIIGLLTAMIPVIIDISKDIEWIKKNNETKKILIDNGNNFDIELQKISRYFKVLDDVKENGIYSSYFKKEIAAISSLILDAAEKKKFKGRIQNFVDEKYIMDCFGTSKRKIWKFTWVIQSEESPAVSDPDVGWLNYWNLAVSLLEKNKISKIEILFISDEKTIHKVTTELSDLGIYINRLPRSNAIEAKAISKLKYEENLKSAFRSITSYDFGIYGDNLLFIYDSDNDEFGWYIERKSEIKKYLDFFDTTYKLCGEIKRK